jgi:hypothetical protein
LNPLIDFTHYTINKFGVHYFQPTVKTTFSYTTITFLKQFIVFLISNINKLSSSLQIIHLKIRELAQGKVPMVNVLGLNDRSTFILFF